MALVEVGPSTPGASPLIAANQAPITSLLNAYRSHARLPGSAIAPGATSSFCQGDVGPNCSSGRFEAFPLGEGYGFNTPYQLADGRVRIEWLRRGRLRFVSILTLSEGKVVNISTLPPVMPVMLEAQNGARPNG